MLIFENKSKIEFLIIIVELFFIGAIYKFLFSTTQGSGTWQWLLFSVIFFLLLPIFTCKLVFKKPISQYYFKKIEISKKNIFSMLIGVGILLAGVLLVMLKLDWKHIFSAFLWVQGGWALTLFIDLLFLPFVVISTEFFFRGFFQKTAEQAWGYVAAIIMQAVLAVIFIYFSTGALGWGRIAFLIFFNLILGFLARTAKSIFFSAAVNWLMLLATDLLVLYKISQ